MKKGRHVYFIKKLSDKVCRVLRIKSSFWAHKVIRVEFVINHKTIFYFYILHFLTNYTYYMLHMYHMYIIYIYHMYYMLSISFSVFQ